jgi:hypothetical protein
MFVWIPSHLSHRWPTFVTAAVCFSALLVLPELGQAQFTQQGLKLVGTGAVGHAFQGQSVALAGDGNTAIVGGPLDNFDSNCGCGMGAAWVFTRSHGAWTQHGNKLVGTGAAGPAGQGWSVALSGDGNTAIVGGWRDKGGIGAAWVFTRSHGAWTQQGNKLVGIGAEGPPGKAGQWRCPVTATPPS